MVVSDYDRQELYIFYRDTDTGDIVSGKVENWCYRSTTDYDLSQFDGKPFDIDHSQLTKYEIIWAVHFQITHNGTYHLSKETIMPAFEAGINMYELASNLQKELNAS